MITNKNEAVSELLERGYPQVFADIWNGSPLPVALKVSCAPGSIFFDQFKNSEQFIPIWQSTNSDYIYVFDEEDGTFVRVWLEDGDFETVGNSYQQFLTHFF